MKWKRYLLFISLIMYCGVCFAQKPIWDSLDVQYRILQSHYQPFEDIIKIKVPPHLSTRQVMEQVKMVVQFPGAPPPRKKTIVYVFKDDDRKGATSKTGCIYSPSKGFQWDLRDWHPDLSIYHYEPSIRDKLLYNTLLDSMFTHGFFALEFEKEESSIKENVAKQFRISEAELDSIYFRVKWWLNLNKP